MSAIRQIRETVTETAPMLLRQLAEVIAAQEDTVSSIETELSNTADNVRKGNVELQKVSHRHQLSTERGSKCLIFFVVILLVIIFLVLSSLFNLPHAPHNFSPV